MIAVAEPGLIFRSLDGWVFEQVFDITDLCGTAALPSCMNAACPSNPPLEVGFEFWDVEISKHPTEPLIEAVGGLGTSCGAVFRSTDHGVTWTSEAHECACTGTGCVDCTQNALYNIQSPSDAVRHKEFQTLYSVSILDGDNTAVASGYAGQHVRRTTAGIWQDRSHHSSNLIHATSAITPPMYGTAANGGTGSTGKAFLMGTGGHIRASYDGGDTWTSEVSGDSWRIFDVYFTSATTGWTVGQYFRIGRTESGGADWDTVGTPVDQGGFLLAITFSPDGKGIAVGESATSGGERPKVVRTANDNGTEWASPAVFQSLFGTVTSGRALRAVDWSSGDQFWAAGDAGLIYRTFDDGESWRQWVPPGLEWTDIDDFFIESLAFADAATGIFVGNLAAGGPVAYQVHDVLGVQTWSAITPSGAVALHGVDIRGDVAYAIGTRLGGQLRAALYRSERGPNGFEAFTLQSGPAIFACDTGENLGDVPILSDIEIAPDGTVWMGGECGRVWSSASGIWTEHKSQTDGHVRGISFPTEDVGYFGCHRQFVTGWSVVKYQTP